MKSLVSLYLQDELDFRNKCTKLYQLRLENNDEFNKLFNSDLPQDLIPNKSSTIFKLMFKCQLPFEMFYTLHECALMATEELSEFYKKPKNSFDAQTLLPYLVLIVIKSFHDIYEGGQYSDWVMDKRKDGFTIRLLLMEHFTVHAIGMCRQDYYFVSFKEVEKVIIDTVMMPDSAQ